MASDPFYQPLPTPNVLVDGIFKGGGAGGITYVGGLQALARNGIWFKRVAGTSAGAITAAIIAAGYDANAMDYLAAPSKARHGPPQNFPAGVEALEYKSLLLDLLLSPDDVSAETKHNNLIYNALLGPTVDRMLGISINVPDLGPFIDRMVDVVFNLLPAQVGPFNVQVGPYEIKYHIPHNGHVNLSTGKVDARVGPFPFPRGALREAIKTAIAGVLKTYPSVTKLALAGADEIEALRRDFADAVMDAILLTSPLLCIWLNFCGDGGLLTGDSLLA